MAQDKTKMEQYEQIQAMVQKEIKTMFPKLYQEEATKYGVADVPLHRHNGLDSPNIRAQDIEQNLSASGSITMATDGTRYRIGLNAKPGSGFSPSIIRFNGIAVHQTVGVNDIRALVVGDAYIGASFYLQPESSSEVNVGGPPQEVIQSSSYICVNNSGAGPLTQAAVSEGHIVSVTFNSVIVARATIPDFGTFGLTDDGPLQGGDLLVDVELETDWRIIGNFVIM